MTDMLQFQADLAAICGYKPLPPNSRKLCRELYKRKVPNFLSLDGSKDSLCSFSGTLITNGYERIVIGDYGAFVEFSKEQAVQENFIVKPGEEYRTSQRYESTVKYEWLTTKDYSDVKIYHQKHEVSYADYKPGHFYVSVFEVLIHGPVLVSTGSRET